MKNIPKPRHYTEDQKNDREPRMCSQSSVEKYSDSEAYEDSQHHRETHTAQMQHLLYELFVLVFHSFSVFVSKWVPSY